MPPISLKTGQGLGVLTPFASGIDAAMPCEIAATDRSGADIDTDAVGRQKPDVGSAFSEVPQIFSAGTAPLGLQSLSSRVLSIGTIKEIPAVLKMLPTPPSLSEVFERDGRLPNGIKTEEEFDRLLRNHGIDSNGLLHKIYQNLRYIGEEDLDHALRRMETAINDFVGDSPYVILSKVDDRNGSSGDYILSKLNLRKKPAAMLNRRPVPSEYLPGKYKVVVLDDAVYSGQQFGGLMTSDISQQYDCMLALVGISNQGYKVIEHNLGSFQLHASYFFPQVDEVFTETEIQALKRLIFSMMRGNATDTYEPWSVRSVNYHFLSFFCHKVSDNFLSHFRASDHTNGSDRERGLFIVDNIGHVVPKYWSYFEHPSVVRGVGGFLYVDPFELKNIFAGHAHEPLGDHVVSLNSFSPTVSLKDYHPDPRKAWSEIPYGFLNEVLRKHGDNWRAALKEYFGQYQQRYRQVVLYEMRSGRRFLVSEHGVVAALVKAVNDGLIPQEALNYIPARIFAVQDIDGRDEQHIIDSLPLKGDLSWNFLFPNVVSIDD